jgi:beta-galactosidase
LKPAAADFAGSLSVPDWPEARGLSASDLRWRTHLDTAPWVVSDGADIGADGLIGRNVIGKGVALFCQVDPDRFQADEKTYFRYTRWRSTRAVAQILANLGASFPVDSRIFQPLDTTAINLDGVWLLGDEPGHQATGAGNGGLPMSLRLKPEGVGALGYYSPDYRTDFPMGDNPYRYYRW